MCWQDTNHEVGLPFNIRKVCATMGGMKNTVKVAELLCSEEFHSRSLPNVQETGVGSQCVAVTKHKCSPGKRIKCGLLEVWTQPEADLVELVKSIILLSSDLEFQLFHVSFASVSSYASTTFDMWTSHTTHELFWSV